jgi:hypothetical protein
MMPRILRFFLLTGFVLCLAPTLAAQGLEPARTPTPAAGDDEKSGDKDKDKGKEKKADEKPARGETVVTHHRCFERKALRTPRLADSCRWDENRKAQGEDPLRRL